MSVLKHFETINVIQMPAGHVYLIGNENVITQLLMRFPQSYRPNIRNERVICIDEFDRSLFESIALSIFNGNLHIRYQKRIPVVRSSRHYMSKNVPIY